MNHSNPMPTRKFLRNTFLCVAAALLAACTDQISDPQTADTAPPSAPPALSTSSAGHDFSALSEDSLWTYIARTDTNVVVGFRPPGQPEGVRGGQVLVQPATRASAEAAVREVADVAMVDEGGRLPAVRVKVSSPAALTALRAIPLVEYVEPAKLVNEGGLSYLASFGCVGSNPEGWSGAESWIDGDLVPWNYFQQHMDIRRAWTVSQGAGIRVGVIDTGTDPNQSELTTDFASGQSGGRDYAYSATYPSSLAPPEWQDDCGHGTHMASVIAAPKGTGNIVGVAWKSSLSVVRHHGDPWDATGDAWEAAEAIEMSAEQHGSDVIALAFGANNESTYLRDEIELQVALNDILFIGAAGSYPSGGPFCHYVGVVFPANMPEVMAVTAARDDGSGTATCGVSVGPEVELMAITEMPAAGAVSLGEPAIANSGKSSNATALVSGIAALVWSENPSWSAGNVRQRLKDAGSRDLKHSEYGYGVVNAFEAVGGLDYIDISGPWTLNLSSSSQHTYTSERHIGFGPFTYQWTVPSNIEISGATTPTATVTVGPEDEPDFDITLTVTDQADGTTVSLTRVVQVLADCDPKSEEGCNN